MSQNVSSTVIQQHLCPERMRAMAMTLSLGDFVAAFETPLMLVKLDSLKGELEVGLARFGDFTGQSHALNVLAFHTVVVDSKDFLRSEPTRTAVPINVAELRRRLSQARYFAIAIEKRVRESSSVHRITVGRARNKDIVLRHPTVSKFHAWFERTSQGELGLADAGSSNATRRNDRAIKKRELVVVHAGDVVRFGRVEAMICDADTLWHSVSI